MIPGLFGSVAPGWTGMSPGVTWPGLGTPVFAGVENASVAGPLPVNSYGLPLVPPPIGAPFVISGGAPALLAAVAMRRGQPQGPASDQDVEEFIYDALELLPGAGDVEVRCDGGRVSLAGSVPHRRVKHDVGEVAWAIPGINDVNNTITITARRRSRSFNRESETPQPGGQGRKQS